MEPLKRTLFVSGDLVIGKGATLVLPMDSKVIVKGKVSFAGAHVALTSLDRSQGPGTSKKKCPDAAFLSHLIVFSFYSFCA